MKSKPVTPHVGTAAAVADHYFKTAYLSHQNGALSEAESWYRQTLQINPKHTAALHLLGVLYAQHAQYDAAVRFIAEAAKTSPEDFSIQNNLGNALIKAGQHAAALSVLQKALELQPDSAEVLNNLGNAFFGLADYADALKSYDQSLIIRPDHAETLCNKANALIKVHGYAIALETVDHALQIDNASALAHSTEGYVLYGLGKFEIAVESFDRSLTLRPSYAQAFYGRGLCLLQLKRLNEAGRDFERVLVADPEYAEAYPELAEYLFKSKRYDEALALLDKAIAKNVKRDALLSARTLLKTRICDWEHLAQQLEELIAKMNDGLQVALPFHLLSVTDNAELHLKAAKAHVNSYILSRGDVPISKRARHDRIRVGYYSADFHDHATMRLMAEFFELHNKNLFEIIAFSFGPSTSDAMRARAISAFDKFIDVTDRSDAEVVQLSRELEIDIAVDLKGFTDDGRTEIFALRAAPIQLNYLGYPGSMGAEFIDYILADSILIPEELQGFYTEKVVRLPHTYQVNDRQRRMPKTELTRAACGLPQEGFIYCCFNNSFKITEEIFGVWMRILQRVPNSILWLFSDNTNVQESLKKEAVSRGLDLARLVFASRVDLETHMARHDLADLLLDTFPYNAHTTASDALWAGLPVLTLAGQSFASRVASSLLHAVDLPELVTHSMADYEELAVKLAMNPSLMTSIRARLADVKASAPLFDTPMLTRDIERAYLAMYERYQANLLPDHLVIAPEV